MEKKLRSAFTLLELVFVLVIVSILSVVAIGSYERDELSEATMQLAEHIRYTRHMAMMEDKFDPSEAAYKVQTGAGDSGLGRYQLSFWQIRFVKRLSGKTPIIGYSIYSDRDRKGNIDTVSHIEPAINQYDKKLIHGYGDPSDQKVSEDSFLNLRYGISDILFSANCQAVGYSRVANDIGAIAFDNNGKPYGGVSSSRATEFALKDDCSIALVGKNGKKSTIIVTKSSGQVLTNTH